MKQSQSRGCFQGSSSQHASSHNASSAFFGFWVCPHAFSSCRNSRCPPPSLLRLLLGRFMSLLLFRVLRGLLQPRRARPTRSQELRWRKCKLRRGLGSSLRPKRRTRKANEFEAWAKVSGEWARQSNISENGTCLSEESFKVGSSSPPAVNVDSLVLSWSIEAQAAQYHASIWMTGCFSSVHSGSTWYEPASVTQVCIPEVLPWVILPCLPKLSLPAASEATTTSCLRRGSSEPISAGGACSGGGNGGSSGRCCLEPALTKALVEAVFWAPFFWALCLAEGLFLLQALFLRKPFKARLSFFFPLPCFCLASGWRSAKASSLLMPYTFSASFCTSLLLCFLSRFVSFLCLALVTRFFSLMLWYSAVPIPLGWAFLRAGSILRQRVLKLQLQVLSNGILDLWLELVLSEVLLIIRMEIIQGLESWDVLRCAAQFPICLCRHSFRVSPPEPVSKPLWMIPLGANAEIPFILEILLSHCLLSWHNCSGNLYKGPAFQTECSVFLCEDWVQTVNP